MNKNEIKRAYTTSAGGIVVYIMDDGSWDGTEDDAVRFPQVEVGFNADGTEDMTLDEIKRAFEMRGA